MAFACVLSELLLPPTLHKYFTQSYQAICNSGQFHPWFKPSENHTADKKQHGTTFPNASIPLAWSKPIAKLSLNKYKLNPAWVYPPTLGLHIVYNLLLPNPFGKERRISTGYLCNLLLLIRKVRNKWIKWKYPYPKLLTTSADSHIAPSEVILWLWSKVAQHHPASVWWPSIPPHLSPPGSLAVLRLLTRTMLSTCYSARCALYSKEEKLVRNTMLLFTEHGGWNAAVSACSCFLYARCSFNACRTSLIW